MELFYNNTALSTSTRQLIS